MTPTDAPNIFYDDELDEYYDVNSEGYIEVFEVKDGVVIGKVDMEEYIERQASQPNIPRDDTTSLKNEIKEIFENENRLNFVTYKYEESKNVERTQYGSRVSIIQRNPGPLTDKMMIAFSYTKSHSFNVSLNAGQKSAVSAGVGYRWSNSETISSSHEMSIPAGYEGYWRFDPRIRFSTGNIVRRNFGIKTGSLAVRATYPVRVAGQLDGDLVSVKTRYKWY